MSQRRVITALVMSGVNSRNISGRSAKAYVVYRQGPKVWADFGPVEAVKLQGHRVARPRWRSKQPLLPRRFGTDARAREFARELIEEKEAKGYRRTGIRILSPARR